MGDRVIRVNLGGRYYVESFFSDGLPQLFLLIEDMRSDGFVIALQGVSTLHEAVYAAKGFMRTYKGLNRLLGEIENL